MRPRVLILGLPYFGRIATEALAARGWSARYHAHPGRNMRGWARLAPLVARADLLYLISSRVDRRSPQALLAKVRRRPTVVHWVGTDVLFALDAYRAGEASSELLDGATHLVDAPWLADEVAEMGVRAAYAPLPVPALHTAEPPALPEAFQVLLYYPSDAVDREVFDIETMMAVARAFPEVRFRLIPSPAATLPQPAPANVAAPGGWLSSAEMDAVYRETTVHVRLTRHDGTSFMAVEALSRGRHVIWTFPMAGAVRASGFDQVSAALGELVERHRRGELGLNEAGRRAVLEAFDTERLATALDGHLRAALRGASH